jgi:hypothetical protein
MRWKEIEKVTMGMNKIAPVVRCTHGLVLGPITQKMQVSKEYLNNVSK